MNNETEERIKSLERRITNLERMVKTLTGSVRQESANNIAKSELRNCKSGW